RDINRWFQVAGLDPKGALALPQDVIEAYARNGVDPISQRGTPKKNAPDGTTLRQWSEKYGELPRENQKLPGLRYVPQNIDPDAYRALWRLTDYKVSSVTGGTVWLRPSGRGSNPPRRRTGRTLRRKKIASSHRRKR